jgi:hypothetical protein
LRNSTHPATLARRIFLGKNNPFANSIGDISDEHPVPPSDRDHVPLTIPLSLSILIGGGLIELPKPQPSTILSHFFTYTCLDDSSSSIDEGFLLVDSDESEDSEDSEEHNDPLSTEQLHPTEVYFHTSKARKNFWNRM